MAKKKYWLMKSEPNSYSISDLEREGTTLWDGVRNHQAKNFMRDEMSPGDDVLFYHSNTSPPGIVGLAQVSEPAQPDPTAFDHNSQYYDPKSNPNQPRWFCVKVKFKKKFPSLISLEHLKTHPKLKNMLVLKKGIRLSVQPVNNEEFEYIVAISKHPSFRKRN